MRRFRATPPTHGRRLSPEESEFWQNQQKTIKPLVRSRQRILPPPHARIRLDLIPTSGRISERVAQFGRDPASLEPAKSAAALQPLEANRLDNVDRATAEDFKRGKLPIEAVLDLHGMTVSVAQRRFSAFVQQSAAKGLRMVLVITGKGQKNQNEEFVMVETSGNLRREIQNWVNRVEDRSKILLIAKAQPRDGGDGAWYLLLKRNRFNNLK